MLPISFISSNQKLGQPSWISDRHKSNNTLSGTHRNISLEYFKLRRIQTCVIQSEAMPAILHFTSTLK